MEPGLVVGSLLLGFPPEIFPLYINPVNLSHSMPFAATSNLDGSLAIWDIPSQSLRCTCESVTIILYIFVGWRSENTMVCFSPTFVHCMS